MHSSAEFRGRVLTPLRLLLIASTVSLPLQGLQAQTGSDPTDSGLVPKMLGAQAALRGTSTAAQDVRLVGNVDYVAGSKKESGSIEFLSRPDGTSKATMTLPSGEHISLRGGNAGGATKDLGGIPQPIASHNTLSPGSWFFPEHLLGSLRDPRREIAAANDHCPSGQLCLISRIGSNDPAASDFIRKMSSMTLDLDQSSLLPKQLDYTLRSNTNRPTESALVQVTYDDYRVVDGHEVPFRIRQYLNGSLHLDITLTNVSLNAFLASSDLTIQ